MNLKNLSDQVLLEKTEKLAAEERRIGVEVLWHLREIEERGLHLLRGFSSMYDYATNSLKYSPDQAYRRIAAYRLLKQVPEFETKLTTGELSVANLCEVQSFLKSEQKEKKITRSIDEKKELVSLVIGKSKLECQKILSERLPQPIPREKVRVLTPTETEIRFSADEELMAMIQKVSDLLSNHQTDKSYAQLFKKVFKIALDKIDPEKKKTNSRTEEPTSNSKTDSAVPANSTRTQPARNVTPQPCPDRAPSRYIPVATKKVVFSRDSGRCSYIDPKTNKQCQARRYLHYDHITPFALGGKTETENLRLLCSGHNALYARQVFGRHTDRSFINDQGSAL